jgi:hypothetical protein
MTAFDLTLVLAGSFLGGFVNAIAGGGGLVTLPVMLGVFPNTPLPTIFGTTKGGMVWGTAWAARSYAQRVSLPWRLLLPAVGLAAVGGLAGAWVLTQVPSEWLRKGLPIVLAGVFAYTLSNRHFGREHAPLQTPRHEMLWAGVIALGLVKWKFQRYMQDYLACVQGVDDSVGEVLDYLDTSGLADNTIVIYSSDNGWYLGDLGLYDKRFMYEPGLRVPLLARGPGIRSGLRPDAFVANIDLAPTFLDLAGVAIPDSMQGRSLKPLLSGDTPADWRQTVYYRYYHDPGHHNTRAHYGVRTATHKLIHYWKKDAWELFDLTSDPTEQHNLLFPSPEQAPAAVQQRFAELRAEIGRLQQVYGDTGQYADPTDWPAGGVGGERGLPNLGTLSVAEAIERSTSQHP